MAEESSVAVIVEESLKDKALAKLTPIEAKQAELDRIEREKQEAL